MMHRGSIHRAKRPPVSKRWAAAFLSLAVGCSAPNGANFASASANAVDLSESDMENFFSPPELDAKTQLELDNQSLADLLSFKEVQFDPSASVVIAGKRIDHVDQIMSALHREATALAAKYKTYGAFRRAMATSQAASTPKALVSGLKSLSTNLSSASLNLDDNQNQYERRASLQRGLLETATDMATSCAASIAGSGMGAGSLITNSIKAYAGWSKVATRVAGSAARYGAMAAAANPTGLAVTAAVVTGLGIYYIVKNCKTGETQKLGDCNLNAKADCDKTAQGNATKEAQAEANDGCVANDGNDCADTATVNSVPAPATPPSSSPPSG